MISPRFFIGLGGPNYHNASPGIDYTTTPFMRALDFNSPQLVDAWPMDNSDPRKYSTAHTSIKPNGIFCRHVYECG